MTFFRSLVVALSLGALLPVLAWAQGSVKLPKPKLTGKVSVETAILRKKSVRNFSGGSITLEQASQLLWACNGDLPTDAVSSATTKVIPSAGGLYPLEVYMVTGPETVTGLAAGVYQYVPASNSLTLVEAGDRRPQLAAACLSQMWMARAPVMVIIGGVFARTTAKYGNQGMQYVLIEAGSSMQNLYLEAEALGLGAGAVGAFQGQQVCGVAKIPQTVTPLLVVAVGK